MTRDQHLKFCRICKNQKFDPNHGIVCGLTNLPAAFEISCDYFSEDTALKNKVEEAAIANRVLSNEASQGKRFANYILDIIFCLIFSFIFGTMLGIFLAILAPEYIYVFEENSRLISYALAFTVIMFYFSMMEATGGRTIAKFLTGTKVVAENGEKPSFGAIIIRSLCRFIPFEQFSFLGSGVSGWHDKFSKTKVVNV